MRVISKATVSVLVAGALSAAAYQALPSAASAPRPGVDWPQFRGIKAAGTSDTHPTPVKWSIPSTQSVAWKTPVPGLGLSSPVVWGNLVCLSTSISGMKDAGLRVGLYGDIKPVQDDSEHEWRVYCLDKQTGAVRWQETAYKGVPKIKRHTKATHANSTLATDGERLIAFFGSEGLYAYNMSGKQLWKRDLGVLDAGYFMVPEAQWETGSSPVIHDNVVVLQVDVQKGSFLGAFDARTGKDLWRTPRTDVPTWGTPTIHVVNGQTQIIVNGWRHIGAYDFKTGKEIWKINGGGDIPVPTPVVHDGLIYITNAHGPMSPVYAVRETATGDVSLAQGETSNAGIAWSYPRDGGYMCTPLVYRGLVYIVKYNGVMNVYDAKTGEKKYQQRLADGKSAFTSSPIAADGKVYLASEEGHVYVFSAGPTFELLAENDMGESVLATPAISEGTLIYRTQGHVIAIKSSATKPS